MLMRKLSGIFGLILGGALLGGCGSTMPAPGNDTGGSGVTTVQTPAAALAAMNWTLASVHRGGGVMTLLASDVPVNKYTLNFIENGNAALTGNTSLTGGCNQAGSDFTIPAPDKITFGLWRATRRACQGSLMQADTELTGLLTQVTNYQLDGQQLRLNGAGNTLIFKGTATDATRYGGEGVRKFIDVRSTKQGLSWREAKYDSNSIRTNKDAPWIMGNFPGIQQFTPEVGMEYTVRINEFRDPATGKAVWVQDMVTMQGIL